MINLIYFFPILSAILGYASSFVTIFLLYRSYRTDAVADKLIEAFIFKLKEIDLSDDLDQLLDKYLVEFMTSLKQQIPMASMFLTESLTQKLQKLGKKELVTMLPELKDKIWKRFLLELPFIEHMIKESLLKRMNNVALKVSALSFFISVIIIIIYRFFI